MSQTKRVFESAFIPYYTHAPVKVRKQSKVSLHKGIKMTDKTPKFPKCNEYGLLESGNEMVELALTQAENKGRDEQYVETINLFNKLRNTRFQFNDEVKMVIDMLKDEMTRLKVELMK